MSESEERGEKERKIDIERGGKRWRDRDIDRSKTIGEREILIETKGESVRESKRECA